MKGLLHAMLVSIALAILVSGCTEVHTMNLSTTYENVSGEDITYVSDRDESVSKQVMNITGELTEEPSGGEAPMAIEEQAMIYVDPENLVKKMCPEQVLLGLRKCNRIDGNLNVTIKNAGYRNLTMIFYMYYEDEEITHVYFGDPFTTKEEKVYTLEFDDIEKQYGEITKIEATPVLVEGLEAISCSNKKLPILVESGCN